MTKKLKDAVINLKISQADKDILEQVAAVEDVSVSEFIRKAVKAKIAEVREDGGDHRDESMPTAVTA